MSGIDNSADTTTVAKDEDNDPTAPKENEDSKMSTMGKVAGGAVLALGAVAAAVKFHKTINRRCGFSAQDQQDRRFFDDLDKMTPTLRSLEEKLDKDIVYSEEELAAMRKQLTELQNNNQAFLIAHADAKTNADRITARIEKCTLMITARIRNLNLPKFTV